MMSGGCTPPSKRQRLLPGNTPLIGVEDDAGVVGQTRRLEGPEFLPNRGVHVFHGVVIFRVIHDIWRTRRGISVAAKTVHVRTLADQPEDVGTIRIGLWVDHSAGAGNKPARRVPIPMAECPMSLGTKNRQQQTAEHCKQHLRQQHMDKLVLVEEFIHELEGLGKERDVTKWGQFSDASHIESEMLARLDEHFDGWLNPG